MRVLWFSFLLLGRIVSVAPKTGDTRYEWPAGQLDSGSAGYVGGVYPAGGSGMQQSSLQQSSQGGWGSSDVGDNEPVFTPVSSEDQVYARKSRSQYRKSNLRFHQFVYVPTEPLGPQEPVYPHHGKGQKGF